MAFKGKLVIALIPARGGSKGIRRKNLCIVLGKPLLAHTIIAAQNARMLDKIYVSSDDTEILDFANKMGVDTIRRSAEAAKDIANASQVVMDFLQYLPEKIIKEDPYLIYLQPTSPLRTSVHIDDAFSEMALKDIDKCLSVTELKRSPFKSFTLSSEGQLQSVFSENLTNANRQDLPTVFYPNGAIYIFPLSEFLKSGGFPSNGSVPLIMSERESIDIDREEDIDLLEKNENV